MPWQRSVDDAAELRELYQDRDGQRLEEMQVIHGPNAFNEFYLRLNGIRDFHRKHPNEVGDLDISSVNFIMGLHYCSCQP